MTRFFVSGAAGFIGSHVVDRLLQEKHQVTAYDNLSSGRREWIAHHLGQQGFRFVEADLLDFNTLKETMAGHEVVWHLGANTDIREGNRVVDLDLKNCTIATHNVLEAMRQLDMRQLLFASSATVYGEIPVLPTPESAGPLLPISLYGAGKLACEGLISAYSHLFGIRACIFRFANVVGGRMGHGVIYDFVHKLRKNPRELEVLGDGQQIKSYFLVEDCIDAMWRIFHSSNSQCEVFNLGCPSTTTVTGIAQIVVEEMGLANVRLKYTGGSRGWPGDVPKVWFDVEKAAKLGWAAKHTSDEAVRLAAHRLIQEARGQG